MTAVQHQIHIPDVSEFQPDVDWSKVNGWNGGYAIARAMYGTDHVDHAWAGRREAFWHHGGRALGIYQYVVADQDAASQGRALKALIKTLRPGEYVIGDFEEGTGSQAARVRAWAKAVGLTYKGYNGHWMYSGEYFIKEHGLLAVAKTRLTWLAAYQSHEPPQNDVPHVLWQNTDAASVPGIPGHVDCSTFDGTPAAFLKAIYDDGSSPRPKPKPHHPVRLHPFTKLKLNGELDVATVSAINYWLGVKVKPHQISTETIRAIQHKTQANVTGKWNYLDTDGKPDPTIHHLQVFLREHGQRGFKADGTAFPKGLTYIALQRYLNTHVGGY